MKTIYFFILFSLLTHLLPAQVTKSFIFGGQTREYIEYVPGVYTGTEAVPLVICLHGLGDDMSNFSGIGMHDVADTANFIVLTPQAMSSVIGNAWNSGASYMSYTINSNIDDVGFLNAMIDTTVTLYNIDLTRIYFTGFSMGGFMCYRLACESGDRIAAIAPVAGTMGNSLQCNPQVAVPVCEFHGTSDQTIAYTGCMYGMDAMAAVGYWVQVNSCDTNAVVETLPDLVADGFTVDHYTYLPTSGDADVQHYRVNGADHQWCWEGTNDIDYTKTIWEFFRRHKKSTASLPSTGFFSSSIYPNPASGFVMFECESGTNYRLVDMLGQTLKTGQVESENTKLNISDLDAGMYILITEKNGKRSANQLLIEN